MRDQVKCSVDLSATTIVVFDQLPSLVPLWILVQQYHLFNTACDLIEVACTNDMYGSCINNIATYISGIY